ncbi:MAG: hypothetical protein A4E27_01423 [Methanobacterium sp. PtaU1.Bin242]|jgi:hypothetical protein|nr:MAG: hypothetical protein A4E27_01423 [Methanobacterium sp. PtaU1.Bin242]
MNDRNFFIILLLTLVGVFFNYLSSGNPGLLVFCLGIIGVLISRSKLINYNRNVYYVILLFIIIVQGIILIDNYLYKLTYLQNIREYVFFAFGILACILVITLLFKPNIFKEIEKINEST